MLSSIILRDLFRKEVFKFWLYENRDELSVRARPNSDRCGVSGVGFVSSRDLIWYLARRLDPPELRDRAV
ncbi:hypothetical protein F2Q69_00007246 [Brassica cretica]|uniref:Uncharacterized protein n=1 Tax=Brassica cretica TaxID=69181 RepID=A0A8S9NZL3_BRACR|nr:hypothetical protein F2Q69_00007246 [Brassica cretica]